jgi:hypothetical protein
MIVKTEQNIQSVIDDLNRGADRLLPGNIFNWDKIEVYLDKSKNVTVYKKSESELKKNTLPDGTIEEYVEITTQYYTKDSARDSLQVIEISILNPEEFGRKKDDFSDSERSKISSWISSSIYSLVTFSGIKSDNEIISLLKSKGFIDEKKEKVIKRVIKPIKKIITNPTTGEEKETIEYQTEYKTEDSSKDSSNFLEKYGIYIGMGILALLLILKK